MIEINLIPDVKQELIKAQRIRVAVISFSIVTTIVSAVVVAALAAYVFGVQTVRGSLADASIEEKNAQLQSNQDLSKVLTIQNQLTKIAALNSAKNLDSRLFDVLAAIIPKAPNTVQISELSINNSDTTIVIQGQTASYQVLEVFKKTISGTNIQYGEGDQLQKVPLATQINTSDITYGEDASGVKVLRFTLNFVYVPELFSPGSTPFQVLRAEDGNATDSYLGLPQSLFVERARDIEE